MNTMAPRTTHVHITTSGNIGLNWNISAGMSPCSEHRRTDRQTHTHIFQDLGAAHHHHVLVDAVALNRSPYREDADNDHQAGLDDRG
jgi:hypothetical protein